MLKSSLQTLKGFRDFLPADAKKRQFVISKIRDVFNLNGFEPLETPALEYEELLLGKYGEEGDKLMYKFVDNGERKVAMRYDQTVPTARILAMYNQSLPMPFKRYQIQPVWRAENTQAGRYREFLQCDADIYGTTSALADAEIISLSYQIYKNLGFEEFTIYINDRSILFELMRLAAVPEDQYLTAISIIDKLDRKSPEDIKSELLNLGLKNDAVDHLFHHMEETKPTEFLQSVIGYSEKLGVDPAFLKFQARLARGLDYYTSIIFEIKVKDYNQGSVLGGGRYDKLINNLSGVDIPAVGFAVGFDRTIEAMEQFNLFPLQGKRSGILVSIFNQDLLADSLEVVKNLRDNGFESEIYPNENARLDKQLKFADKKGIKWLIVIGPDEAARDSVILKDLETGEQEDTPLKSLLDKINI